MVQNVISLYRIVIVKGIVDRKLEQSKRLKMLCWVDIMGHPLLAICALCAVFKKLQAQLPFPQLGGSRPMMMLP